MFLQQVTAKVDCIRASVQQQKEKRAQMEKIAKEHKEALEKRYTFCDLLMIFPYEDISRFKHAFMQHVACFSVVIQGFRHQ
jgi:hypothetical protein